MMVIISVTIIAIVITYCSPQGARRRVADDVGIYLNTAGKRTIVGRQTNLRQQGTTVGNSKVVWFGSEHWFHGQRLSHCNKEKV